MTLTIELTHEEEATLTAMALAEGLEPAAYAKRLLGFSGKEAAKPRSGAELLAAIDSLNLSGTYGDPNVDAVDLARNLRSQMSRRDQPS